MQVLLGLMTGTWDSRPGKPAIRLRVVEFWKGKPNEHWVYLEHVAPGEERVVRQRIFRLSEAGGKITAESYLPADPKAAVGEWRNAAPFAHSSPSRLRALDDCIVVFEHRHGALFAGGTEGKACRGDRPRVAYERSEFLVTSSEMRNLEQGYDAAGERVAGEPAPWDLLRTSRDVR